MALYSIKDLENLSGIKAHTLRIWEKRYDLITPKRTKTNIRYYTDDDLHKLLNICQLYKNGMKISKIGELSEEDIKIRVAEHSHLNMSFEDILDALLLFILELDSHNINRILDKNLTQNGLEKTMEDIIYPLLDKLSIAWMAGSFVDVHESFITQIIKAKIYAEINKVEVSKTSQNKNFLLFLPPNEQQELSLIYLHYLLIKNGCSVINLGTNVSIEDVKFAVQKTAVNFIFTMINEEIGEMSLATYIGYLRDSNVDTKVMLAGYQTLNPEIVWSDKLLKMEDLSSTLDYILTAIGLEE